MAGFAYLAAEEAARIKFEATADDALNRIESRVDLHLSLLRETDAFFTARAGQVSGGEFKTYFDALRCRQEFRGAARRSACSAWQNPARRPCSNGPSPNALGVEQADLSACLGRRLADARAALRAARPGQADRHRLRHVQRPAASRGDPGRDRNRRTPGNRRRVLLGQQTGAEATSRLPPVFDAGCGPALPKARRPACSLPHSARRNCSNPRSTSSRRCRSMPRCSTARPRHGEPAVPF